MVKMIRRDKLLSQVDGVNNNNNNKPYSLLYDGRGKFFAVPNLIKSWSLEYRLEGPVLEIEWDGGSCKISDLDNIIDFLGFQKIKESIALSMVDRAKEYYQRPTFTRKEST